MAPWKYNVEGWGEICARPGEDYFAKRDALVKLLRESKWYAEQPDGDNSELAERISDLEACEDVSKLDLLIWPIYNLAD